MPATARRCADPDPDRTGDGAFEGTLSGEARFYSGIVDYAFDKAPVGDVVGSFQLPASFADLDCAQPEIVLNNLHLSPKRRRAEFTDIHDPGYAALFYACGASHIPVGLPRVQAMEPLE